LQKREWELPRRRHARGEHMNQWCLGGREKTNGKETKSEKKPGERKKMIRRGVAELKLRKSHVKKRDENLHCQKKDRNSQGNRTALGGNNLNRQKKLEESTCVGVGKQRGASPRGERGSNDAQRVKSLEKELDFPLRNVKGLRS